MSFPQQKRVKIVFMGTPEFAVESLRALVESGYEIAAVVTAPDKLAGRGMKINESPVKKYAIEHRIRIFQPEKLKNESFVNELKSVGADLQVVVAFRMLPEIVWNMPPLGTINVHASLLPQYRGAAPINWAIINGETETGITTFRLKHEIDTGDLLLQEKVAIGEDETAGELHDKLKTLGAKLLVKTIRELENGSLRPDRQSNDSFLKRAPKIFTDTCRIDWTKTTNQVHNLVRGLSPAPGAFTTLNGKMLKIFRSEKEIAESHANPGEFKTDYKSYLKFATIDGFVKVKELQLEGKKKMNVEEFLKGYRFGQPSSK